MNKVSAVDNSAFAGRASTRAVLPVVVIAASTGGPRALRWLVPRLSTKQSAFYVIVQHLPVGFSGSLARDLNNLTSLTVREAETGDSPTAGTVLIAPAGRHCTFSRDGKIAFTNEPLLWGVRPAADITMCTAAEAYGPRVIGVILTGMGCDGAHGLSVIREKGGRTIAEHELSCIIYGMPKAAIEAGVVDQIAPLEQMPSAIAAAIASAAHRIP
ncbi:MAG: CheB methylesterase domain-containing protein [Armatimonadota bacterium]